MSAAISEELKASSWVVVRAASAVEVMPCIAELVIEESCVSANTLTCVEERDDS